jgi:CspA family cold shock protein
MATGAVKWFNDQPRATASSSRLKPASPDVFVHISAVERAGLRSLPDGTKLSYDLTSDKRTGKSSADNLSVER